MYRCVGARRRRKTDWGLKQCKIEYWASSSHTVGFKSGIMSATAWIPAIAWTPATIGMSAAAGTTVTLYYSSNTRDTSNRTDDKDGKEWKLAKKQVRCNGSSSSNSMYEGNSSIAGFVSGDNSKRVNRNATIGVGKPTTARTSTRWHKKKDLIQFCSFTMKQLFVTHGKSTYSKMHTWTFISAIPIGFQMANQKTRRHTKTLKGSHRMEDGQIFLKTSAPYT